MGMFSRGMVRGEEANGHFGFAGRTIVDKVETVTNEIWEKGF